MRTCLIAAVLICLAQGAEAFMGACSYSSTVRSGNTSFAVNSNPAAGCLSQTIVIEALRGGRPPVRFISGVEYLPVDSWAADLDGDGNVEFVLASNAMDNGIFGVLDVYYFEGNLLRRTTLPELSPEEQAGYRGRDTFKVENNLIVRTFPVSTDDDAAPARKYRTLRYRFDHGAIAATGSGEQTTIVRQPEAAAATGKDAGITDRPMTPAPPTAAAAEASQTLPANSLEGTPGTAAKKPESGEKHATGKPVLSAITTGETLIDIRTAAPAAGYSHMLLDSPPRLVIDIPGADSALKSSVIKIRKFGIKQARIGRNKGFLRIVLDSNRTSFPPFRITSTDTGLRIGFSQ